MAVTAARPVATVPPPRVRRSRVPGASFAYVFAAGDLQLWPQVVQEAFPVDPFRVSVSIRRLRIQGMATGLPKLQLDIVDINRHFTVLAGDIALSFHGPEDGRTEMWVFRRPETLESAAVEKGQAIVAAIRDELAGRRPDLTLVAD
jgi:hypothetical protein